MRAKLAALCTIVFASAGICSAQAAAPTQASYSSVYCSGFVTDQKVPDATRVVSAEQSNIKLIFSRGDYVTINRGQDKGVRVGDRYSVVRQETDPSAEVNWFKWQAKLMKAMGTHYLDAGQLRVVNVQAKTATAEVTLSCDYMQRGDIALPFQERPEPAFKDATAFDHFAPVSGKPVAMIVQSRDYQQSAGQGNTVYVNLGTEKGVKVGDFFRIFRYQGTLAELAPQTKDFQDRLYGFGSSPSRYRWNDLPREVLGEGVVINVSRNSSTVFVTFSSADVYAGDYIEVE